MANIGLMSFLVFFAGVHVISSVTNSDDVAVLRSLKDQLQNTPPSWGKSDDPCGEPWEGVICNKSRVTQLRLSSMGLAGTLSSTIGGLNQLISLNLAHNKLTGPLPDLTGMNSLLYVDLSNNSFVKSEAPAWFSTLHSLTTLAFEYGPLQGPMPHEIFNFPQIQQVKLRNNTINGTLVLNSRSISKKLQIVDFRNNQINSVSWSNYYNLSTLRLGGNPVCPSFIVNFTKYCH